MLSAGFKPTIPAIEQPQTYTLDCMATGNSQRINDMFLWKFLLVCNVLWKFNYILLYGTVLIAFTLLVLSFTRPGKKDLPDITV